MYPAHLHGDDERYQRLFHIEIHIRSTLKLQRIGDTGRQLTYERIPQLLDFTSRAEVARGAKYVGLNDEEAHDLLCVGSKRMQRERHGKDQFRLCLHREDQYMLKEGETCETLRSA